MSDTTTTTGTTDGKRQFDAAMLSKCRALLAEESAVLVSLERGTWRKKVPPPENSPADTPPTYTDAAWVRIVRRWPRISDGDRAMCEEFLARFASVKNATVAPPATEPAECGTVEEPKTDRETFSGTWRMRKTALSALKTDPMQQGVYQTLVWPAEFNGEVGGYCAESSALHHEDATIYTNAAEPPDAEHQDTPGVIVRVNGNIDPDTGLWSGQKVVDTARTPDLYGTWSVRADSVTLRVRGEHREEPLFPLLSGTTVAAIKALADDFVNATASTDEQKAAALAAAIALCDHPVVSSTADMDQYALFSVSAEITFPVASLVAAVHDNPNFIEVEAGYSNYASVPAWSGVKSSLSSSEQSAITATGREDYKTVGGSPHKNEFGLLEGTVTWRIPKASETATWGKRADSATLHLRREGQTVNDFHGFPTFAGATVAAIQELASPYVGLAQNEQLSTKIALCDYPVMNSTVELDAHGLFNVNVEITFPVESHVATVRVLKRSVEVEFAYSNWETEPTKDDLFDETDPLVELPTGTDVSLLDYALGSGTPHKNEFGLLDGTVTWRIPVQDASVGNGDGLVGTWGRSAERWTLRIRGDYQKEPPFPTPETASLEGIQALAQHFRTDFPDNANPMWGNPVMSSTADMDAYGLFTVSAEIVFPVAQLAKHVHEHPRWTDVDITFENQGGVPALSDVHSGGLTSYARVGSAGVRQNEFGLLDGTLTWRVPKAASKGWIQVGSDEENPIWRCWGWNQPGGIGGSTDYGVKTGTVTVTCLGVSNGTFTINGSTHPSGTRVTLNAGTSYLLSFNPVTNYTAPASRRVTVPVGTDLPVSGTYAPIQGSTDAPVECDLLDRSGAVYVAEGGGHVESCVSGDYYQNGDALRLYMVAGGVGAFSSVAPVSVDSLSVGSAEFGTVLDAEAGEYYLCGGTLYSWDGGQSSRLSSVSVISAHHTDGACDTAKDVEMEYADHIGFDASNSPQRLAYDFDRYTGELIFSDSSRQGILTGHVYYFTNPSWGTSLPAGYYESDDNAAGSGWRADLDNGKLFDYEDNEICELEAGEIYFVGNQDGYFEAVYSSGSGTWSLSPAVPSWTFTRVTGPKWRKRVNGNTVAGGYLENGSVYYFSDLVDGEDTVSGYFRANENSATRIWRFTAVTGPRWFKPDGFSVGGYLENGKVYHFSAPNWGANVAAGYYKAVRNSSTHLWTFESVTGPAWFNSSNVVVGYLVDGGVYSFPATGGGTVLYKAEEARAGEFDLELLYPVAAAAVNTAGGAHGKFTALESCDDGVYYTDDGGETVYLCDGGELDEIEPTPCAALDEDGAVFLPSSHASEAESCEEGVFYAATYEEGGILHYYDGSEFSDCDPSPAHTPAGTLSDPIPIQAVESVLDGPDKIVPYGGGTAVPAVSGRFYVLMSNGALYRLEDGTLARYVPTANGASSSSSSSSSGTLSLPTKNLGSDYYTVNTVQLDFNEFGLVDYVCTAEGERNPWGGGVTYSGGKTLEKYVFIENHKNATLNSSTGYWQGTSDSTTVKVHGYRTPSAAASAANAAVSGKKNSETVQNNISKHGHWYVLTTHVIRHNNG